MRDAAMDQLHAYGWNEQTAAAFARLDDPTLQPARVIEELRGFCEVMAAGGPLRAALAARLRHDVRPAVGDWVALARDAASGAVVLQHVLERRSRIARKVSGRSLREQVLAANLDTVFLVTTCDDDFSPRRIERYLTLVWDGGAQPVVLINKTDLIDDAERLVRDAETAAIGVPVHAVCARRPAGLDPLTPYLQPGRTVALLGSSGVGKSTIVNRLIGADVQPVQTVREEDAKGRHTTTSRQLFRLPSGTLLIDTPGLREVGLWQSDGALDQTFPELEGLAASCRFTDCAHEREPGCAVLAAVASGALAAERLESYRRLRKELEFLDRKVDAEADANVKRHWRSIHRSVRQARKKGWLRGSED